MKVIIRFNKLGSMMYIGHLDLMRYFQKLFRRCGLDVAYSQGFNPHQLMSFASPLGLGLTSIGEYLDINLLSLNYNGFDNERCKDGETHTIEEWIDIINEASNGLVNIVSMTILPDDAKTSMSQMAAATYKIDFEDNQVSDDIVSFFNESKTLSFLKKTKKSEKEIDIKEGILVCDSKYDTFAEKVSGIASFNKDYEEAFLGEDTDGLYLMCISSSALNIKPEMLIDLYKNARGIDDLNYEIMRLDMFKQKDKYISMSIV